MCSVAPTNPSFPTLASLEAAAAATPTGAAAFHALGSALAAVHEFEPALEACERARVLEPHVARNWTTCGDILVAVQRVDEAVACYEQALVLAPDSAASFLKLARVLVEHGRNAPQAEQLLLRAIQLDSKRTESYSLLAQLAVPTEAPDVAIRRLQAQLGDTAEPRRVRASVAWALAGNGRYDEAKQLIHSCLRERPGDPTLLLRLADLEVCLGNTRVATELYEVAAPSSPGAVMSYVQHLIRLDRMSEAKSTFRRFLASGMQVNLSRAIPPQSAHPPWNGASLEGRTILLRTNTTYGDAIQFACFARLFRDAGANVVIETYPRLVPLFRTLDAAARVVTPYEDVGAVAFDVNPATGSLLLDWEWQSISAGVPYLHPPLASRAVYAERLKQDVASNVGIAWQGQPLWQRDLHRRRDVQLEAFARIAAIPGVRLWSLQFGSGREQLQRSSFPVTDLGVGPDFMSTAAAISELDLVITVDTVIAHLAGALGVRCLVALPYVSCWRWMDDRSDSRFYPTVSVYRQSAPGSWDAPLEAIGADVAALAARVSVRQPEAPQHHAWYQHRAAATIDRFTGSTMRQERHR